MARRQLNPLSTAAKIGIVGLTAIGLVGLAKGYDAWEKNTRKKKKQEDKPKGPPLQNVYVADAVIGNAPRIVDDVMLPIELSFEPQIRNPNTGDLFAPGTNVIDNVDMLSNVVTNLSPQANNMAYEYMLHLVANKGYDLSDPATRDEAVQETASKIAPRVDWTKGLQPYAYGSPEVSVWIGAPTLGEIAHQSYWNKQA